MLWVCAWLWPLHLSWCGFTVKQGATTIYEDSTAYKVSTTSLTMEAPGSSHPRRPMDCIKRWQSEPHMLSSLQIEWACYDRWKVECEAQTGSSHPRCPLDCIKRWQSDHTCHHLHRFNELATTGEKWNAKPRLKCLDGWHPPSKTPVGVLPWTW